MGEGVQPECQLGQTSRGWIEDSPFWGEGAALKETGKRGKKRKAESSLRRNLERVAGLRNAAEPRNLKEGRAELVACYFEEEKEEISKFIKFGRFPCLAEVFNSPAGCAHGKESKDRTSRPLSAGGREKEGGGVGGQLFRLGEGTHFDSSRRKTAAFLCFEKERRQESRSSIHEREERKDAGNRYDVPPASVEASKRVFVVKMNIGEKKKSRPSFLTCQEGWEKEGKRKDGLNIMQKRSPSFLKGGSPAFFTGGKKGGSSGLSEKGKGEGKKRLDNWRRASIILVVRGPCAFYKRRKKKYRLVWRKDKGEKGKGRGRSASHISCRGQKGRSTTA